MEGTSVGAVTAARLMTKAARMNVLIELIREDVFLMVLPENIRRETEVTTAVFTGDDFIVVAEEVVTSSSIISSYSNQGSGRSVGVQCRGISQGSCRGFCS